MTSRDTASHDTASRDTAQCDLSGCQALIESLDRAVAQEGVNAITHGVEHALSSLITRRAVNLPSALKRRAADSYARHLVYRSPDLGYTVLAMVWGPRQGTPIHDHAGMWCVEGVLEGRIAVTQYEMAEKSGEHCRFLPQETIHAGIGDSGRLIPPFDHHTIVNPQPDHTAITLHVYGGEMAHCSIFEPLGNDWYARRQRTLRYTA